MGRPVTATVGDVTVTISGDLQDDLLAIAEGSQRRILQSMIRYNREIVAEAKKYWPVKSGRSRDGFRVYTKILPGGAVTVSITNDARNPKDRNPRTARYPFYTRTPIYKGAGGSYWNRLVRKPWNKGIKKLVDELEQDLIEAAKAT
jgi:hypothetical protein